MHRKLPRIAKLGPLTAVIAFAIAVPTLSSAQTFQGIGFGFAAVNSIPHDLSADGTVVVGDSEHPVQAFRWAATTGVVGLGFLPGGFVTEALGVDADGSVVVGADGAGGCGHRAFRWTPAGGMLDIGHAPGMISTIAYGVSADGSVVVGDSNVCAGNQAARWTASGGWVNLGFLPGHDRSQAFGVNANGAVAVGISYAPTPGLLQAFRWTAPTGMVGIGHLSGGNSSGAVHVNFDGTTVVGFSNDASGLTQAFRWTSSGGMVGLGFLPGGNHSDARRVSADGSVVVGASKDAIAQSQAIKWTATGGMQSVKDLLLAAGVSSVAGWQLTVATGVSADGTIISGRGVNPQGRNEGWIAHLPVARSKDDCKDGGWAGFTSNPGPFRNQGQCVSHFSHQRYEDLIEP